MLGAIGRFPSLLFPTFCPFLSSRTEAEAAICLLSPVSFSPPLSLSARHHLTKTRPSLVFGAKAKRPKRRGTLSPLVQLDAIIVGRGDDGQVEDGGAEGRGLRVSAPKGDNFMSSITLSSKWNGRPNKCVLKVLRSSYPRYPLYALW